MATIVKGSNGNMYEISNGHCTCPDHKYRGNFCKHLKMVEKKTTKKVKSKKKNSKKFQKKMRRKRKQISDFFNINNNRSSLLILTLADELGISDDFNKPPKAKKARKKLSSTLRKPGLQEAIREFNNKLREFCAKPAVATGPDPILVKPRSKVAKVSCGKGSHQLYMTEK